MKKFVLYARSSNKDIKEAKLDFAYQLEHLKKYALKFEKGHILGEFMEIAPNDTLNGRPELQKAIDMANANNAILMVDHVHVLALMMRDLLKVLDDIDDRFYCCYDLEEGDPPYDKGV